MRMARRVEPGLVVQADGVHYERLPIPSANGVSHPCGIEIGGMPSSIGPDLTLRVACFEQHENPARSLEDFERTCMVHQPRNAKRSAARYVGVHSVVNCA